MTQFTFSELKPRIKEAIRTRMNHYHNDGRLDGSGACIICRDPHWNNEPIELVDGFTPHYFFRIYQDAAISRHEPHVEAIGKYTGQVYTWSLKALLPELWEEK